jgi:hypothetical protein
MSVISVGIPDEVEKQKKFATSPVKVWKFPEEGKSYILAADPCSGIDGGDNAAIEVIDAETGEQCAEFAAVVTPENLAPIIFDLAKRYNNAEVSVEVNSVGLITISILTKRFKYENIYRQKRLDRLNHQTTEIVGWWTDFRSKTRMESAFREFFGSSRGLIHSKKLLDEVLAYDENESYPNDRVMAMMIALTVRAERMLVASE